MLRVSPKARALATISPLRPFLALLATTCISPEPPNLPVSPKATAIAFKSFHLLLSPNTEYGGQGRIVQAIIAPKYSPCLRSLFSPCFAEGQSTSDHQPSASLLRTSSHHVYLLNLKLIKSTSFFSYMTCYCSISMPLYAFVTVLSIEPSIQTPSR